MASIPNRVLEPVVFKLKHGVKREEFLPTNDAVSNWMKRQPGFISRKQAYGLQGDRWIDVIWWKTSEDAHAAAEVAMSSESCAPMFALIDDATLMIHADPFIGSVHADATPPSA